MKRYSALPGFTLMVCALGVAQDTAPTGWWYPHATPRTPVRWT